MGEILQDSEQYILQWWDEFYGRWNESHFCTYADAVKMKNQFTADDMRWGRKTQCRIVKETTKQEVVDCEKH
jgi:hypothetical protein